VRQLIDGSGATISSAGVLLDQLALECSLDPASHRLGVQDEVSKYMSPGPTIKRRILTELTWNQGRSDLLKPPVRIETSIDVGCWFIHNNNLCQFA